MQKLLRGSRSARPPRGPWRLTAALMALLLSSTPALAPASPAPSEIDSREQFRKALVAESINAVRDNRLPDALAAWRRAYEIRPDPRLACNIGKAEMEHGSAREAATYLATCLRLAPPSPPPGDKLKLARYADDLKKARHGGKEPGSLHPGDAREKRGRRAPQAGPRIASARVASARVASVCATFAPAISVAPTTSARARP